MVAATVVERPRHLRLVTAQEFEPRGRARAVEAAAVAGGVARGMARGVAGGMASDLTYLRRRLVAVGLVVLFLLGIGLALGRAGSQRAGAISTGSVGTVVGAGADAADALPIAQREYVVQPGDTLWKIARALQPEGDVRPLVYELGKSRDGAPLRAGERIRMP